MKSRSRKVVKNQLTSRVIFVTTGGQIHVDRLSALLDEHNLAHSIVTEYYQMELTTNNLVILRRSDALKYLKSNHEYYTGTHIYILTQDSKENYKISNNITVIKLDEESIMRIIRHYR